MVFRLSWNKASPYYRNCSSRADFRLGESSLRSPVGEYYSWVSTAEDGFTGRVHATNDLLSLGDARKVQQRGTAVCPKPPALPPRCRERHVYGRWGPDCTLKPYTAAPDHLRPYSKFTAP